MADELQTVVQRMIDAGESEENIGTVIAHYHQYTPDSTMQDFTARSLANQTSYVPPRKVTDELGNEVGGMAEGPAKNFVRNVVQNPAVQSAAYPSTLSDLAALALPTAPGAASGMVQGAKDTIGRLRIHPSALLDVNLARPLSVLRKVISVAPEANPALPLAQDLGPGAKVLQGADQFREPYHVPTVDTPQPGTASGAPSPSGGLSAADRAGLVKQGYAPDVIAKIEAQVQPVASHPLTAPRVDVGAEAVAKAQGLTKQGVRDVTGPIYGEAQGEAAPVFPESTYQRIVGKMRTMHPNPGDPSGDLAAWQQRLNYANAANDPKTASQIVTIMRQLRDSHLAVPAAVAGGMTLRGRMMNEQ